MGSRSRSRSPHRRERVQTSNLFVKNIGEFIKHEDLYSYFSEYGRIHNITVPVDYYSGRQRGFAFIQFNDQHASEDALRDTDGKKFMGRYLEVTYAYGDKKTPDEMKRRDESDSRGYRSSRGRGYNPTFRGGRGHHSRRRSRSRDRDRSRRHSHTRRRSRRSPTRSRSASSERSHKSGSTMSAEAIMAANGVDVNGVKPKHGGEKTKSRRPRTPDGKD